MTIACLLLWLLSTAMIAGGLLLIAYAVSVERPDPWSTIMPFLVEMLVALLIGTGVAVAMAGAVLAAFAIAAFRGAPAARWVLAGILVPGVILVLTGHAPLPPELPIGWRLLGAVTVVVPVVLLFLPGAGAWLSDLAQYRNSALPAGPPPNGQPGAGHHPYQPFAGSHAYRPPQQGPPWEPPAAR
ncbi:MAG: hypothetical protein GXX86_08945 [Propionibacterium sp.]|nr:hypothetical protein [Propionibacterium sp.]